MDMKNLYLFLLSLLMAPQLTRAAETVTELPQRLFLVGQTYRAPWDATKAIELNRRGDGLFHVDNCILWGEDDDYCTFHFLTARDWNQIRYVASVWDEEISPGTKGALREWAPGEEGENGFRLRRGVYNITADINTMEVSVEQVGNYEIDNYDYRMSFWEGPINEALRGDQPQAADQQLVFAGRHGDYLYYRLHVAEETDPVTYVSQCWFGAGKASHDSFVADKEGIVTRVNTPGDDSFNTYYFDVHTSDVYVPLKRDFWCDNSRMEVGMTVKAIYLRYDLGNHMGETPVDLYFSSTGDVDYEAPDQRPLNSDTYSLTLSDGPVYDALRRTRQGQVTTQFVRHNSAEWGYVINLGHDITTDRPEEMTLNVNGKPVNVAFDMTDVNTLTSASSGARIQIGQGLTFSRIILMVSGHDYDTYHLFLSRDGKYPEGYETHSANPQLKVWSGNQASWSDLYENESIHPTHTEGTVKYYEFSPVLSGGKATNLYHLEFPGGVKIHKAGLDGHYDQFNIIDQDGYDISNPFRGAQYIYPESWWCANPNLLDDNGPREYLGRHFKAVPSLPSRVDLSFNLSEGEEEMTVYGITLFKIIGRVFSVYTEGERYSNLYYLYLHTTPPDERRAKNPATDNDLLNLCEQTSPILLRLKDALIVSTPDEFNAKAQEGVPNPVVYSSDMLDTFEPMTATEFNNPRFDTDKDSYYHLTLSDISLGNEDLNYVLANSTLMLRPGNKTSMEFVDVTGTQRWSAPQDDDLLRANKWSNYYSSYFSVDRTLAVQRPAAEYYKVVLGTNPDQVRFQIMSDDISLLSRPSMDYSSIDAPGHNSGDLLIYPVADLSTILVWRNGYTIDYTLDFLDQDGEVVKSGTRGFTSRPEGSTLPDVEAFYAPGEGSIEVDLGRHFIDPGCVKEVRATALYRPVADDALPGFAKTFTSEIGLDYGKPSFESFEAAAAIPEFSWGTTYSATLSWTPDPSDYPRHYEIYQYDLTGITDKDNHIPADESLINKDNSHLIHQAAPTARAAAPGYLHRVSIDNATPLYQGETINGKQVVTIGYRGRAVYTYAVPSAKALMASEATPRAYDMLPEGFVAHPETSHGDNLADHAFATALFDQAVISGVEEVPADGDDATAVYFNLQGGRVDNPGPGVYIRQKGSKAQKVTLR